mmetsp:Transcript_8789/g.10018  ORF Transcript_8789/g.10018 Transcript_8789/m.10018 type:complete len:270 (+) Transcript_8789:51-860(+)
MGCFSFVFPGYIIKRNKAKVSSDSNTETPEESIEDRKIVSFRIVKENETGISGEDATKSNFEHVLEWRKTRYNHKSGLRLRSLLRDPEDVAASRVKYKEKTVDWINLHYSAYLSVRKNEYLLEKELMEAIIEQLNSTDAGWKVVMYEYKLHRWDGDLIFVKDETLEEPTILVVEAKVLTGAFHDQAKLEKVIKQAETYRELARGLFHGKCKVFSIAVLNIAVNGVNIFDTLYIPNQTLQYESKWLLEHIPDNWASDWSLEDLIEEGYWE